jgi:hypothetical protein
MQKEIFMMPGQALCNPAKVYSTLDDICKFSGLGGAERYFVDPNSQEGQQASQQAGQAEQQNQQKQDAVAMEQMRMQAELARSATTTAEAQTANVQLKGQAELAKHQRDMDKLTYDAQIKQLQAQLASAKLLTEQSNAAKKLEFDYDKLHSDNAMKLIDMETKAQAQQDANYLQAQETIEEEAEPEESDND